MGEVSMQLQVKQNIYTFCSETRNRKVTAELQSSNVFILLRIFLLMQKKLKS